MKRKGHLNPSGLSQITQIKRNMNKGRAFSEDKDIREEYSTTRLFMYNRDCTILYHSTDNVKEFSEYFKIYKATLFKHIEKGTYYLGKYLFS